jgi:vesicle-associated membrane protein 7
MATPLLPPGGQRAQIVYSLIARERSVVVEYSPLTGNFTTVARMVLEKLPALAPGHKRSYVYDQFVFHYAVARAGLTFLCLADRNLGREAPYKFLQGVGDRWTPDMSVEAQQQLLRQQMTAANEGDTLARVRQQLAEVSDQMVENIDKVIARQERIELLVEKSDALDRTAAAFRREATDLRRALWWRGVRTRVYLFAVIAFFFMIALWRYRQTQNSPKS